MDTKVIGNMHFSFGAESILVTYNKQCISVNNYYLNNKRTLQKFRTHVTELEELNINDLYGLVREHHLNAIGVSVAYNTAGTPSIMW